MKKLILLCLCVLGLTSLEALEEKESMVYAGIGANAVLVFPFPQMSLGYMQRFHKNGYEIEIGAIVPYSNRLVPFLGASALWFQPDHKTALGVGLQSRFTSSKVYGLWDTYRAYYFDVSPLLQMIKFLNDRETLKLQWYMPLNFQFSYNIKL